jgi:hypothetical protein
MYVYRFMCVYVCVYLDYCLHRNDVHVLSVCMCIGLCACMYALCLDYCVHRNDVHVPCIYMYVCMYVCMYACMSTGVCAFEYLRECLYACMYAHTTRKLHVCIYDVCMYVCM